MKKTILIISALISCIAASHAQTAKMPYTASYSSNFTMSDPDYSGKILMLWKDCENNTLDNHVDLIADTVTMILSDGTLQRAANKILPVLKDSEVQLKTIKYRSMPG